MNASTRQCSYTGRYTEPVPASRRRRLGRASMALLMRWPRGEWRCVACGRAASRTWLLALREWVAGEPPGGGSADGRGP